MGAGASSLPRVRKALLIRAYNIRAPDQTLLDQFIPHAFRGPDMQMYIFPSQVQKCLDMNKADYAWLEELLRSLFTVPSTNSPAGKELPIKLFDFIHFLETGKLPVITSVRQEEGSESCDPLPSTATVGNSPGRGPPRPPGQHDRTGGPTPTDSSLRAFPATEEVVTIDLARISPHTLPPSIKLKDDSTAYSDLPHDTEPPLQVMIVDPRSSRQASSDSGKQVWRKREVVRQERTIHYTTMDDQGALQELVEKEVTQTEVLHMECRDTGEFAHRESTQYEQLETFNNEVVSEVTGAEEYVHLKSLEDEFQYMDSTMPPKGPQAGGPGGAPPADGSRAHPMDGAPGSPPRSPTVRQEEVREEDVQGFDDEQYVVEEPSGGGSSSKDSRPPLYPHPRATATAPSAPAGPAGGAEADGDFGDLQYVDISEEETAGPRREEQHEMRLQASQTAGPEEAEGRSTLATAAQHDSSASLHDID